MVKIFIYVFFCSICRAAPILVSLGENCNVAMALAENGLRKQALPFDWNITPFLSLYHVFSNDFSDFLQVEDLVLRQDLLTVVNQNHKIEFVHDFPLCGEKQKKQEDEIPVPGEIDPDFLKEFSEVQEKYQRRIARLYDVLRGDEEVILIRHNHRHIAKEEVIKFYQFLQEKFPSLNFTLVVWGYEEEMGEDWGYPGIKNYQFIGNSIQEFYENLFYCLGVIEK
jgi:hypothetical protein